MHQGRPCPIGISITHIVVGYLGISLSFARTYIVGANFLACGRSVESIRSCRQLMMLLYVSEQTFVNGY
jgi:hypothetical protein